MAAQLVKFLPLYFLVALQGASAFAVPYNHYIRNGVAKSGLNQLSVTELKRLLTERGIDFRDCLEKRDLVERLEHAQTSPRYVDPMPMNSGFSAEENRLVSTVKRVSPSVAFITTLDRQAVALGFSSGREGEVPLGTGSGFLWDKQGHVVTNCHVVLAGGRVPSKLKVKLQGMAQAYEATVVGVEKDKDLAVLKMDCPRHLLPTPLHVGTSNDLQVGQSVLAIGNPFGLDNSVTSGIVSALGRDIDGFGGRIIKDCIQTDASINPGNSGGPLMDSSGRLIGVNTAILAGGSGGRPGNIGIGFAIPVDTVRRVVNQLIRFGKVVRPTMGINVVDDRVARSIEIQLRRPLTGVLVREVISGSPAQLAGLKSMQLQSDGSVILGDLITHVNGQAVKQVEDLLSAIEEQKEGDLVQLTVQRSCDPKQTQIVQVRLISRDGLESRQSTQTARQRNNSSNGVPNTFRRGFPSGPMPWQ